MTPQASSVDGMSSKFDGKILFDFFLCLVFLLVCMLLFIIWISIIIGCVIMRKNDFFLIICSDTIDISKQVVFVG